MTKEDIRERNREKLHRILDMILDGNGFESRKRDETGTLPTLFFEYSGQVNLFKIALHKDGWFSYADPDRKWEFYLNNEISDTVLETIDAEIKDSLKDDKELDTIRRDIKQVEDKLAEDKKKLSKMKKTLKKKEKEHEADT